MFRDAINTPEALTDFVHTLSSTLTLSACAELIDKHITDPKIREDLDRVVGRKGDKPLKDRLARELAAKMLGFDNVHVMSQHYKAVKPTALNLNHLMSLVYENRFGTSTEMFSCSRQTVYPIDVIGPMELYFEAHRDDESITLVDNVEASGVTINPDNPPINLDHHIGTLCIEGPNFFERAVSSNPGDMKALMEELIEVRRDLMVGNWELMHCLGDDQYYFGSIERTYLDRAIVLKALDLESSGPVQYDVDEKQQIVVGYHGNTGEIVRVIFLGE